MLSVVNNMSLDSAYPTDVHYFRGFVRYRQTGVTPVLFFNGL